MVISFFKKRQLCSQRTNFLVGLFILFVFNCVAVAQNPITPFIQEKQVQNANFTSTEQQIWDSVVVGFSNYKLVEIGDLSAQLSNGVLNLVIPGTTDSMSLTGLYYNQISSNEYSWWGNASLGGSLGIVSNSFGRYMEVYCKGKTYRYFPLSSRYNVQAEQPAEPFLQEEPEMDAPPDITFNSCEASNCSDVLNVLVLVTPEALAELGSKYQSLPAKQKAMAETLYLGLGELTLNVALLNSGIIGKSARFVTEFFEDFEFQESQLIFDDAEQLINHTPAAVDRLITNRADIMVLVTDSRYGSIVGYAPENYPIALVAVGYLGAPRYTFAHEIGHTLGAQHNRVSNGGDADDTFACNYGYKFQVVSFVYGYTIMARMTDPGASRLLYFSNPQIKLNNTPIGTDYSNNSNYISKTFCEKADLFPDEELAVTIDGPTALYCNQTGVYAPLIDLPGIGIPGQPPYTFSWFMGEAPFTSPGAAGTIALGHNSTVSLSYSTIAFEKFWLLLTVVSNDGVMMTALTEVDKIPCADHPGFNAGKEASAGSSVFVFPNPAGHFLNVKTSFKNTEAPVHYQILDVLGKVYVEGELEPGLDYIDLTLPSGFYTITIHSQDEFFTQKFAVNQ